MAEFDGQETEYFSLKSAVWVLEKVGCRGVLDSINNGLPVRIKPKPDPYAALKEAHAAGKVIELRHYIARGGRKWFPVKFPDWSAAVEEYRIRPEPETVPLAVEDCVGVSFRSLSGGIYTPTAIVGDSVYFCDTVTFSRTFAELKDQGWEYSPDRINWKPCSKTK